VGSSQLAASFAVRVEGRVVMRGMTAPVLLSVVGVLDTELSLRIEGGSASYILIHSSQVVMPRLYTSASQLSLIVHIVQYSRSL
jgi:hypothetical protein